jgi:hypothetical protein
MMRSSSIQLILDEESSVWCSHLVPDIWVSQVLEERQMGEKGIGEGAAMMTLVPTSGQVGSSTIDPTYLPDDRVTLSRFLLFVLLSSVSRVFEMSERVVWDDINREAGIAS